MLTPQSMRSTASRFINSFRKRNKEREENPYLRPEDVIQEFPEEDEAARLKSKEALEMEIEARRAQLLEEELPDAQL